MKLVSVEEMRRIEQLTDAGGQSYAAMMEKAGWSVARMAQVMQLIGPGGRALLLIGPGNNGGDGLVAAHYLREAECEVTLYVWKRNIKGDQNFSRLKRRKRGVTILWSDDDPDFARLREALNATDLVVDALLGTGVARPLEGRIAELLAVVKQVVDDRNVPPAPYPLNHFMGGAPRLPLTEVLGALPIPADLWSGGLDRMLLPSPRGRSRGSINPQTRPNNPFWDEMEDALFGGDEWDEDAPLLEELLPDLPVLAVDCPSGLNCDTGALDPATVPAHLTVTFAYPKWGQAQPPGAGACGLLSVVDIGVPPDLGGELRTELLDRDIRAALPARPRDANKGTFGKAMIVGGSTLYPGAPALSGSAAMRAGAGLVTVAVPAEAQAMLAGARLELTWLPLPGAEGLHTRDGIARLLPRLAGYDALLVGPGLTTEESAKAFLLALLEPGELAPDKWRGRAVFDADALNILSQEANWPARLPELSVLTPHPGEMSRLTGKSVAEINGNRIATAREHAQQWGHVVLLKGAHTVIAHPDGRAAVLPFADPALAKAGSGDVLAGVIVALLAQGLDPYDAAAVGGYVHGLAGTLAGRKVGAASTTAVYFIDALAESLMSLYAV